jgi:UDP-galactopyranose mutase
MPAPLLSWGNVVATLGIIGTIMAGEYFILVADIASLSKNADTRFTLMENEITQLRADTNKNDQLLRKEIDYIKETRLTKAAHDEFVKRVDQYMATPFLRDDAFKAWETERNKLIDQLIARINAIENEERHESHPAK